MNLLVRLYDPTSGEILLDEATSGVDSQTEEEIKEIFESIKGKGHYDKIIEGFKILKVLNYEVFINIPFQTMDIDKIMDIVGFAMLNNIKTIRFSPIIKKTCFKDLPCWYISFK